MKKFAVSLLFTVLSIVPAVAMAGQTEPSAKAAEQCAPPEVVAGFLGLSDAQVPQFVALLGQFQATLHGVQEQIALRQVQLDTLLRQPNPDPAVIGSLFLQIHALQQQAAHVVQAYQDRFASLLTEEQKQKVQAVTQASQLQPVVGAFVALYLAPVPTPLPCPKQ